MVGAKNTWAIPIDARWRSTMGNLAQSYIADAIRAVAPRFGTIKQTNVRDLRA